MTLQYDHQIVNIFIPYIHYRNKFISGDFTRFQQVHARVIVEKKKFHTQLKKGIILLTLWLSQSSLEIISRIFLNKLQRENGFCVFNLPKFLGGNFIMLLHLIYNAQAFFFSLLLRREKTSPDNS